MAYHSMHEMHEENIEANAQGYWTACNYIQGMLECEDITKEQVLAYVKAKKIELDGEYGW